MMTREQRVRRALKQLANRFTLLAMTQEPMLYEGVVKSVGRQPYKRLDWRGRAVLYIHLRPRKILLRLEFANYLKTPKPCVISDRSSHGPVLEIRRQGDFPDALRYLSEILKLNESRGAIRVLGT